MSWHVVIKLNPNTRGRQGNSPKHSKKRLNVNTHPYTPLLKTTFRSQWIFGSSGLGWCHAICMTAILCSLRQTLVSPHLPGCRMFCRGCTPLPPTGQNFSIEAFTSATTWGFQTSMLAPAAFLGFLAGATLEARASVGECRFLNTILLYL